MSTITRDSPQQLPAAPRILPHDRLPLDGGLYQSRVSPGLWLDPEALLSGAMAKVIAVLQQGIASPEHQAFVEQLRRAKK
jgi:hypothetical protein